MTFLFIIDVKNEEAFCVDCRPTISHNILKKHSNNQVLLIKCVTVREEINLPTNEIPQALIPPFLLRCEDGTWPFVRLSIKIKVFTLELQQSAEIQTRKMKCYCTRYFLNNCCEIKRSYANGPQNVLQSHFNFAV